MVDGKRETTLGLGERLRSARKGRALTLQQAAFTLRLEESVLRALEDERYEVLGAAVFVRGHLKAYAKLLGLSEEVVLAAYRNSDPDADAPPKVTRELEKPLTTTPGPGTILAAVAVAVLVMLLVYMLSSSDEPAQQATETLPTQEGLATVDMVPVLPQAPTPTPEVNTVGDAPGDDVPPATLQAPPAVGPGTVGVPVEAPPESPAE